MYGSIGKIELQGIGGSYGLERITLYKMREEMGPPDTTIWEYPRADRSWGLELDEFFNNIETHHISNQSILEAVSTLKLIEQVYSMSNLDG